jgi:hypothetical protein
VSHKKKGEEVFANGREGEEVVAEEEVVIRE